jgi:adenine deaminase
VARNNKALFENTDSIPEFTLNSIHINDVFLNASSFRVTPREGNAGWVQAMEMYDGYFKRAFHARLLASPAGSLEADVERDILKVTVIDRHHGTENCGIGFVRGFGLQKGAIACTTNCENQNLVVIGTSDEEIAGAVRAIIQLGGGFVAVLNGEILESVKLDVAGCMSSQPWEKVRDDSLLCDDAVHNNLGSKISAPFMIASFVGLVGVPDLGLTELGLVDCKTQGLMDVVLSDDAAEQTVDARGTSKLVKICCRCPSHAHDVHRMMDNGTALRVQ